MENKRFSAGHVPYYTKLILSSLWRPVILYLVLVGNFLLGLCVFGFYQFEYGLNAAVLDFSDAVYWGFATVTTVGYGDIVPVTNYGRVISIVVMILGVSFFLAFTSIWVTSFLAKLTGWTYKYVDHEQDFKEVQNRLSKIESQLEKLISAKGPT